MNLAELAKLYLEAEDELLLAQSARNLVAGKLGARMREKGWEVLSCGDVAVVRFGGTGLKVIDAHDLRADLEKIADG